RAWWRYSRAACCCWPVAAGARQSRYNVGRACGMLPYFPFMTTSPYKPAQTITGPAYSPWFKLLATVFCGGLLVYGISIALRFPLMQYGFGVKALLLCAALLLDRKSTSLNSSHVKISNAVLSMYNKLDHTLFSSSVL